MDAENSNLRSQRTKLEADIASLQKQLAGIIVCPKCQHEFTLANDVNINEVKLRLQDRNGETQDILQNIEANEKRISDITTKGREARKEQDELNRSKIEWSNKITETCTALDELSRNTSYLTNKMQNLQHQMNTLQKSIDDARTNLFDDSYAILDEAIKIIIPLRDGWRELSKQLQELEAKKAPSIQSKSARPNVYAGMTYGKSDISIYSDSKDWDKG